jgi:uncharacterized protein YyaL (SSP411 family)
MTEHPFTNRLIHETSPYLLQHSHNPVEWNGWNEESLARSKKENKPILLSIGYSACHWCHVMEKESFEDQKIAELMNRNFICIKVDREERPDLDQIYQNAVQIFLKRGGGWPLTMFLTPDQVPFYGGTYFPPTDRYQIPGFPRVLEAVAKAYRENQDEVSRNAKQVLSALQIMSHTKSGSNDISPEIISASVKILSQFYNPTYGGFGKAPKFPNSPVLELHLRHFRSQADKPSLERVLFTLSKMGTGGMYDQLGGGFHRYSVDEKWLVPHFEKMLYDNAQLVPLYLIAFQISKSDYFKKIAIETLDYVLREMTSPEGGFYSTQDADSEGIEGKFFVWSFEEVSALLTSEERNVFCRYFDITLQGNFEQKNILNIPQEIVLVAGEFARSVEQIETIIHKGRARLFEEREKRIKPFRDEKILTGWNGLMISAFIKGYRVTQEHRYLNAAKNALDFIFTHLYREEALLSCFKDNRAKFSGYLDDYAYLTAALLDYFEVSFEKETLKKAESLMSKLQAEFWDSEDGGFFFTGTQHEQLISRSKNGHDHSIPSGNSVSARNLIRLFHITGNQSYINSATRIFKIYADEVKESPFGFGSLLCAFDQMNQNSQIVLVARKKEELTPWIARLNQIYLPNTLICPIAEEEGQESVPRFAQGMKSLEGRVTAYFCRDSRCSAPLTDWEALELLLLSDNDDKKGAW